MLIFVEISNPFRRKFKRERIGVLHRFIWLWFSVGYINAGFNSLNRAVRLDERDLCAKIAMNMPAQVDEIHQYRSSTDCKAIAWDISYAIQKREINATS
jgi:hypothetical protein